MSNFKIAWMFPDTLFLHGERGNLLALERFARMAGFDPLTDKIDLDSKAFNPEDYQVIFFGPGEISAFPLVMETMDGYKDALKAYVDTGRPMIVSGTSVGMFCKSILGSSGEKMDCLGFIDAEYIENEKVYGDDIFFNAKYRGKEMEIIGNQIQMGDLILGSEKAFGQLRYGYGNTGKALDEGAIKQNSIFTNTLGPMLICNPWLTIEIIKQAAETSGLKADESALDSFDDSLERASLKTKAEFIKNKETHLKNCSL